MQSVAPAAWLASGGKPEEDVDCSPINNWFGGFHIPQTSSVHAPAAWKMKAATPLNKAATLPILEGASVPLARSIKTTMPGMKTKLSNVEVSSWQEQSSGRHSAQGQPGQFASSSEAWVQRGQCFQRQVCIVWMILNDPRTPWYVRVVAAGTVGYLFSPVQLIPSFIPVIGFLDDFAALWLGFRFIQRFAPEAVVRDSNEQATKMPPISARELKRVTWIAAVAFVLIGLSGAVFAAWWLFR